MKNSFQKLAYCPYSGGLNTFCLLASTSILYLQLWDVLGFFNSLLNFIKCSSKICQSFNYNVVVLIRAQQLISLIPRRLKKIGEECLALTPFQCNQYTGLFWLCVVLIMHVKSNFKFSMLSNNSLNVCVQWSHVTHWKPYALGCYTS